MDSDEEEGDLGDLNEQFAAIQMNNKKALNEEFKKMGDEDEEQQIMDLKKQL